jgi:hypothetical protein
LRSEVEHAQTVTRKHHGKDISHLASLSEKTRSLHVVTHQLIITQVELAILLSGTDKQAKYILPCHTSVSIIAIQFGSALRYHLCQVIAQYLRRRGSILQSTSQETS